MQDTTYTIYSRSRRVVNTDPQRRCYNGVHYKWEYQWGSWDLLVVDVKARDLSDRLRFWRELNEYAISQRGPGAMRQFAVRQQNQVRG